MVVLDSTIVNIALPQAQADLHLSDALRQWVVTGYALTFGSLLLLGGRIADYAGRRRTLLIGLIGFGAASTYGGLVQTSAELIAARAAQGAFAALMAPAALAVLTTTFPVGRDRNIAFALFGAIGGSGAGVGLLLGGALTEFLSWRWCLLVNTPVTVIVAITVPLLLRESRADGEHHYDVIGTVLVTLGLAMLVGGTTAVEVGKGVYLAPSLLIAGTLSLVGFFWSQTRVRQPLLPLRVITHPVRGGALLLQLTAGSVMLGVTLYLAFHLQTVLRMPPLISGIATMPLTLAIGASSIVVTAVLHRTGPRWFLIAGPLIAAVGAAWLTRLTVDGDYWTQVFPGLVLLGFGLAMVYVPVQNLALLGVDPSDAGAAGAANTATTQVGGSLGLGIYSAIYALARGPQDDAASMVIGYDAVFLAVCVTLVLASIVAAVFIRGSKERLMPADLPADFTIPGRNAGPSGGGEGASGREIAGREAAQRETSRQEAAGQETSRQPQHPKDHS